MERHPIFMDQIIILNIVKLAILPKLIYRFVARSQLIFYSDIDILILQFIWIFTGLRTAKIVLKKQNLWASMVVQWLGIRLPMQGTRVRALIWENPTCHGATKPVRHNY